MFNNLTEVVKQLIIINVIIFFVLQLPMLAQLHKYFVFYPLGSDYFQPVQLITHMFNHGNTSHLFFNMLGLFFFGPHVERLWGPKRFLTYYLICGAGAIVTHILLGANSAVLGASGAISGVVVAFAWLFPNVQVMLLIPPIPMKAKYMAALFIGIDLFMGFGQVNSGIAHFAHLGGALAGIVLILIWKRS